MGGMPAIPEKQKKLLYSLGTAVVLALWVVLLIAPQWGRSAKLGQEVKSLSGKIQQARRLLSQAPNVEQNMERLEGQVAIGETRQSPQERLPELMDKIAQVARSSRVRVVSLKPRVEISGLAPGSSGYLEVPIEVTASAGYHQVGAFLDALESSEIPLRVHQMQMGADSRDLWSHRVVILLQAYLTPAGESGA